MELENPNPIIHKKKQDINMEKRTRDEEYLEHDIVDEQEVYDIIKNINDPEHPLTLEQLNVVCKNMININYNTNSITVYYCPTIPNCSMATTIGLLIKVKLMLSLPSKFKIKVYVQEGKHIQEISINKQLQDKERVFAAFENENMKKVLRNGIENTKDFNEYIEKYNLITYS